MNLDTIFRLFNFFIVVGLILYIVRRYGIIFILSSMRQERDEKSALKKDLKSLQKEYAQMQDLTEEQENSFKKMQAKFKKWTKAVEVEQQQEKELLDQRKVDIENKQIQKVKSLQQRKLIKEQLPGLVQEIEKDLQKDFVDNEKQAQVYTDKLLKFLEE